MFLHTQANAFGNQQTQIIVEAPGCPATKGPPEHQMCASYAIARARDVCVRVQVHGEGAGGEGATETPRR